VISNGNDRYGLDIQGEQLVAGCWQSTPFALGTAVGIIPCGKGRIIFSTLDVCAHLGDPPGPADVARNCSAII
jgi:beta-galactosidase